MPATITVLNMNDSGADSLRAAIEQANLDAAQDTIDFAPSVTGTITLLSPLPDLSTDMSIVGPGPSALTVARSGDTGTPTFRIFNVTSGTVVTISGLAITNGDNSGGGILNSGTMTLTNSTLSGNGGGAIDNTGTMTLTNSTLSGNVGGGIENNGMLTVTTSILANSDGGNLTSEVTSAQFVSGGHNLFSDTPAVPLDPTDLTNTDPLLGPLTDNGGPTLTMALLPGSPAIDAGTLIAGLTTDQRGVPRPQGAAPDIGAFESRGFTLAVVSGDNQSAPVGSAFPELLTVRITSPFGEPVAGGRGTFAAPTTGASAILSADTAIIDANGQAAVTATGGVTGGTYTVIVGASGAQDVTYTLTNAAGAQDVTYTSTNLALPTPTEIVEASKAKKGLSAISIIFNEPLDPGSASNRDLYGVHGGVKKRGKIIYRKNLRIKMISYDSLSRRVTITLAKPYKGAMEVTVQSGIVAANGASSRSDFTAVVN